MAEVKIPEFLKYNPNRKKSKLSVLINQYEGRFGRTWSTEPFDFSVEELEKIFEKCLNEDRTFYDVIGFSPEDLGTDEEW